MQNLTIEFIGGLFEGITPQESILESGARGRTARRVVSKSEVKGSVYPENLKLLEAFRRAGQTSQIITTILADQLGANRLYTKALYDAGVRSDESRGFPVCDRIFRYSELYVLESCQSVVDNHSVDLESISTEPIGGPYKSPQNPKYHKPSIGIEFLGVSAEEVDGEFEFAENAVGSITRLQREGYKVFLLHEGIGLSEGDPIKWQINRLIDNHFTRYTRPIPVGHWPTECVHHIVSRGFSGELSVEDIDEVVRLTMEGVNV